MTRLARAATTAVDLDAALAEAVDLHKQWKLDAAEARYREVLAHAPDEPQVLQRLGALLAARNLDGDLDEAVEVLERAVGVSGPVGPHNVGLHGNFGNALRLVRRYGEAETVLRSVVAVAPGNVNAWHNLGQLYKDCEHYDEAAAALRRAIALDPAFADNHVALGNVLVSMGRIRAGVASYRRAIEVGCGEHQLFAYLGIAHRQLGELDDAEYWFRLALETLPDGASAHSNLAIVLTQKGRFDEALTMHDRAVALEPENVSLLANRAYASLTAGNLPDAWDDWEAAFTSDGPRGKVRKLSVPRWQGEDVSTRRVMVHREQGVGDEILFASCYADLIARAAHVVIESDPRLASLFARSFPAATARRQTVEADGRELLDVPDFDVAVPAGTLPVHLRRSLADFPDRPSYLVADPARIEAWRERLAATPGPRVGISWRSKLMHAERRLEYTRLTEWAGIFAVPGVSFFNLQYDDCERDLDDAERRFGTKIHRFDDVDYMNDFETVAALMANLDLVVAPRNAVAMLAGALGVPTVMMGNRWDWSDLGTDTCPWLPSVTLVYRQPGEEWDDVLATAARRVADLTGTPRQEH